MIVFDRGLPDTVVTTASKQLGAQGEEEGTWLHQGVWKGRWAPTRNGESTHWITTDVHRDVLLYFEYLPFMCFRIVFIWFNLINQTIKFVSRNGLIMLKAFSAWSCVSSGERGQTAERVSWRLWWWQRWPQVLQVSNIKKKIRYSVLKLGQVYKINNIY